MKPAPFVLHRPTSLAEALDALAAHADQAKVLAGGQSLMPILNMRLASPRHVVDISGVSELDTIHVSSAGVTVGAGATHASVERHDQANDVQPLIRQALRLVAHPVIRNRGTTVGSLVHADPSGEMTAVLALLEGTMTVASTQGERRIRAVDFFQGPMESDVRAGELAVSAFFPALPRRSGTAFVEIARRHGDYAMCGVAALVTCDSDGDIAAARVAYISMGPTPAVIDVTQDCRIARRSGSWGAVGRKAAAALQPEGDIHASADYRRHLAAGLTARACESAFASISDDGTD